MSTGYTMPSSNVRERTLISAIGTKQTSARLVVTSVNTQSGLDPPRGLAEVRHPPTLERRTISIIIPVSAAVWRN